MATKDDRPGLLSKVALFVRNPTKDWSEIGKPPPEQESGYDKQALKAMIERKRQNDFVRKREFDQLRKLRNRDPSAVSGVARPSFFQSSLSTDQDGRAVTLKKIDEIEAQMSKQWWKGKQEATAVAPMDQPAAPANPPSHEAMDTVPSEQFMVSPTMSSDMSLEHFDTTSPPKVHLPSREVPPQEYATTQMGADMPPVSSHVPPSAAVHGLNRLANSYDGTEVGFSTSKLFAIEVEEMATDPELEEAAIRFANGDDVGAEQSLLQVLGSANLVPESARSWAAALLDLYRATNNQNRFDWAVVEFSALWDGNIPKWFSIAEGGNTATTAAAPFGNTTTGVGGLGDAEDAIWCSPPELTAHAMEELREAMASQPMPWTLGWAQLRHISADAMPLLDGLFSSLCNEPVSLRFSGAERLVHVLRSMMPSGDRNVSSQWWLVRLNALRSMHMHDEFELVALDYCVTFEVSPPAWEPARCTYESVQTQAGAGAPPDSGHGGVWVSGFSQTITTPVGLDGVTSTQLELRGNVLGDATQELSQLAENHAIGDRIVVSCQGLVRVDFSAAGSILNWVAQRQSEGHVVQFRDVHRLVAAFFNVIGINEHARVSPRPM